jgi:hypothetical protein
MEMLAIAAGLSSMLVSLGVGIRLIRLASHTQQLPELLIGLSMVLMGFGWSAMAAAGRQAEGLSDPVRVGLLVSAALCAIVGSSCLAMFNWQVFRPHATWPGLLSGAVALGLTALCLAQTVSPGWLVFAREERGPWHYVAWVVLVVYFWSAIESRRLQRMMVRRQRLGLVDPIVVDRVRLWSITMLSAMLASLMFAVLQAIGIPIGGTPIGLGLTAVVALISSATLLLAFVPPSSYLASVRRRAVAVA